MWTTYLLLSSSNLAAALLLHFFSIYFHIFHIFVLYILCLVMYIQACAPPVTVVALSDIFPHMYLLDIFPHHCLIFFLITVWYFSLSLFDIFLSVSLSARSLHPLSRTIKDLSLFLSAVQIFLQLNLGAGRNICLKCSSVVFICVVLSFVFVIYLSKLYIVHCTSPR